MRFDVETLLAGALIGQAVNIRLKDGTEYINKVVKSIDPPYLDILEGNRFQLDDILYVERSGGRYPELQLQMELARKKVEQRRSAKENKLTLAKRFSADLSALCESARAAGAAELEAFLSDPSVLAGDIRRQPMEKVDAQLEAMGKDLPPRQAAYARAIVSVAKRDAEAALKPYVDLMEQEPWPEFVRGSAAKLAVISMQILNRENPCGFIFWIDQLLQEDPQQVYSDPGLWLNYLNWCVTFQHFAPLCELLPKLEVQGDEMREAALDALVYVFALNDHVSAACDALLAKDTARTGRMSVKGFAIRLIDDPMSYCVRYADRVMRMIEDGDLGRRDRGYIYDYVRSRKHCHVVNGVMCSYHLHETAVNAELIHDMKTSLAQTGDYPADLVELKTDAYGAVIELNRW